MTGLPSGAVIVDGGAKDEDIPDENDDDKDAAAVETLADASTETTGTGPARSTWAPTSSSPSETYAAALL